MKENALLKIHLSILFFCTLAATTAIIIGWNEYLLFRILAIYSLIGSGTIIVRSMLGMRGAASFLLAPLAAFTPIIIVGSIVYSVLALTLPATIALFWLPFLAALLASRANVPPVYFLERARQRLRSIFFGFSVLILIILQTIILVLSRTTDALLGPWYGMNPLLFLFYGLSVFLLIAWFAVEKKASVFHLIALCAQFFISFSVALIRFPLTFGFDPILHQAAERLVLEQGYVAPKTFYYIGQYVLVPFIARIANINVELIHQFLLPVLLALSLPPLILFALHFFKKTVAGAERALVLAPLFLTIPYPHLVMTTPWGLAYGITVAVVISSALAALGAPRFQNAAGALTLAALAFHPLAGIPLFFFFLLTLIARHANRYRIFFGVAVSAIGALTVPFSFFLNSLISSQGAVALRLPPALDARIFALPRALLETRFSPLLDAAYAASYLGLLFFSLCALYGCWIILKKNALPQRLKNFLCACLLASIMAFASGVLTFSVIRFETLAQFEQYDYAIRLFQIAGLFLLPVVALSASIFLKKIFAHKNPLFAIVCVLALAGAILSSFYLSYPRNDAFVPSHAYTLSSADIAAVRFIDADADEEQYAVLANQVVASAAIREYGFKKYFTIEKNNNSEQVFYYPVPSGSPLAQLYYMMLRQPSRATAEQAMSLLNISRIYLVVRDYEFRFPIIVRDGKATADQWQEIDNGKAFVFIYYK